MAKYRRHVFVCINQREPGSARPSCNANGKSQLHTQLKQAVDAAGLKGTVRVNKAGCLDQCEHGPNVVVYPEAVWYGHVSTADVAEIVASHLVAGQPVERLVLPDACIHTEACEHRPPKT
ncbi:MAG: (2Fe-2S) ferredoxin domain-containing protein [Acidobacteriaceae bacterium]